VWEQARAAADQLPDATERARGLDRLGERPQPLAVGDTIETRNVVGGESVFWGDGVRPVDEAGNPLSDVQPQPTGAPLERDGQRVVTLEYPPDVRLKGFGNFRLDFLIYKLLGIDLHQVSDATLGTLELFPKIVLPFLVMIGFSLITQRNSTHALDRYYAKMKTPVSPDREQDERNLTSAYSNPQSLESKKLFPGSNWEFQKPSALDVVGFVLCLAICFAIVGISAWAAGLGGP
jgi:hypothetical protein